MNQVLLQIWLWIYYLLIVLTADVICWEYLEHLRKIQRPFIQIFHQEMEQEKLLSLLMLQLCTWTAQVYPYHQIFLCHTRHIFPPGRSVVYRCNTRGCYSHITCHRYHEQLQSIQTFPEWRTQILHRLLLTTEVLQKHHRISGNSAAISLSHNECIINWSR